MPREDRDEQPENISDMSVTLEVSQPERSREARDEQPSNMEDMSVADEVSRPERSVYCQALADKIGVMISTLSAFRVPTSFSIPEIYQA